MELVKIVANSIPISPMAKASRISTRLKSPGAANQSAAEPSTYISENSQMKRIRWPEVSANAPRTGASSAMTSPAPPMP